MSVIIEEKIDVKEDLKAPSKWNLFALNNDLTAFDEVVFILTHALNMSTSVASEITVKIDQEGRAKLNPKPMSQGLAQAQLDKVNATKRQLATMRPFRASQIMMLKFMIKED
jgi:ATP-dependent Clp protease adapter protein ClpS